MSLKLLMLCLKSSWPVASSWPVREAEFLANSATGTQSPRIPTSILFQRMEHQAAEELGIEVGRFGGHFFEVVGDLFHVAHGGGGDEDGEVALLGGDSIGHFADQVHVLALGLTQAGFGQEL